MTRPVPVVLKDGSLDYTVQDIISHRKRGRKFQLLTLMKGAPRHEAARQPTADFIDTDGTVTSGFLDYIQHHNILRHFH